MRLVLSLVLALQCTFSVAQPIGRPVGTNCSLAAPPATAGEDHSHGIIVRIYPRAKDIDANYTGCQLTWLPDGRRWQVVSIVEIKSGDPLRIWSPDNSDPVLRCFYRDGKVISGDAKNCAAPEFLITKSMASGCVEKVARVVAQGGVGTRWPAGCEYE
jgi:hypothetical protein